VGHFHLTVQILLTGTGDVQELDSSHPERSVSASKWRVGSVCVEPDRKRHDGIQPSPRRRGDILLGNYYPRKIISIIQ
jgi:hypothetical protein